MKKLTIIAASLAVLMSAAGAQALDTRFSPAPTATVNSTNVEAQPIHWRGRHHRHGGWHRIGPRRVARILHRHGYRHVRHIRPRGDVYIARAIGRHGHLVRVVVSAHNGAILDRRIIRRNKWRGGWRGGWHGGWHGSWR